MPDSPWQEFWYHLLHPPHNIIVTEEGGALGGWFGARQPGALASQPECVAAGGDEGLVCWRLGAAAAPCMKTSVPSHARSLCAGLPRPWLTVSPDNRGHQFADVALELQQDEALTRRVGEAGTALVRDSLEPAQVQASRVRRLLVRRPSPCLSAAAGSSRQQALGARLASSCHPRLPLPHGWLGCPSLLTPCLPAAAPRAAQAYWQLLLQQYRALQNYNASLHPDVVPLERSILVPEVGEGFQAAASGNVTRCMLSVCYAGRVLCCSGTQWRPTLM